MNPYSIQIISSQWCLHLVFNLFRSLYTIKIFDLVRWLGFVFILQNAILDTYN